jgi:hypothetical protein
LNLGQESERPLRVKGEELPTLISSPFLPASYPTSGYNTSHFIS